MNNLASATLDVARAGLSVTEPLTVNVTGDGPMELTLVGPWLDGPRVISADLSGSRSFTISP